MRPTKGCASCLGTGTIGGEYCEVCLERAGLTQAGRWQKLVADFDARRITREEFLGESDPPPARRRNDATGVPCSVCLAVGDHRDLVCPGCLQIAGDLVKTSEKDAQSAMWQRTANEQEQRAIRAETELARRRSEASRATQEDQLAAMLGRMIEAHDGSHSESCDAFGHGSDEEQEAQSEEGPERDYCDCGGMKLRNEARALLARGSAAPSRKGEP